MRFALLVLVLGGLTLFAWQNWSISLPLVFLGIRTQPLPLALWILVAIAAGAVTSLITTGLLNFAAYLATRQVGTRNRFRPTPKQAAGTRQPRPTQPGNSSFSSNPVSNTPSKDDKFAQDEFAGDGDEEFIEDASDSYRNSVDYETKQQIKTSYRSGSVYSYSYQDPSDSGVGNSESVYDADYRVIVPPPYQAPNQPAPVVEDDDDWGFDDDDEFEDEDRDRRSKM